MYRNPKRQLGMLIVQACITFQSLALLVERVLVERYKLGFLNALTCLSYIATVIIHDLSIELFGSIPNGSVRPGILSDAVQTTLTMLILLFALTLPQGPSFKQAVLVDREYTTSIWNRFTYQWSYGILRQARAKTSLDLEDLPLCAPQCFRRVFTRNFEPY